MAEFANSFESSRNGGNLAGESRAVADNLQPNADGGGFSFADSFGAYVLPSQKNDFKTADNISASGLSSSDLSSVELSASNSVAPEVLTPPPNTSLCPIPTALHVEIDDLPGWFQQKYKNFDLNKNGSLSDSEVDTALSNCVNWRDRSYLELLKRCKHSPIAAQYGLDRPNKEISPADMREIDSWIKAYNQEIKDFAKNDSADAQAIDYLRDNYTRIDSDKNGRISKNEINSAVAKNPQDAKLSQLQSSFDIIAASTGGKPASIGSKEIATFTLDKNIDARSGFPYFNRVADYFGHDLKVGVYTAIEELRRTN